MNLTAGIDGKYGRWEQIIRENSSGKLEIFQNMKMPET